MSYAAVGSVNNTFGIEGVAEHTIFFKSIDDANRLRRTVSECFERASLPQTSQQVMLSALTVRVANEIHL